MESENAEGATVGCSALLGRLRTPWPAEYALQPVTAEQRRDVIAVQLLKADAADQIQLLVDELARTRAAADNAAHALAHCQMYLFDDIEDEALTAIAAIRDVLPNAALSGAERPLELLVGPDGGA